MQQLHWFSTHGNHVEFNAVSLIPEVAVAIDSKDELQSDWITFDDTQLPWT